jgi:protease-4
MTRRVVHIGAILSAKWLVHQSFAEAYFPVVHGLLNGQQFEQQEENSPTIREAVISGSPVYFISEYGESSPVNQAPKGSVAVIDIKGPITKADQYCGSSGTETKAALLQASLDNPNIKGVILNIDSGGGEGNAVELLTQIMKSAQKPVVSFINGMAASAAYWIASAGHKMIISGNVSEVGSIGAYIRIADFTKYYETLGIDIKEVYAPQSEKKNESYRELLAGKDELMKADLEKFVNFFIDDVKQNRQNLSDNEDIFKGAMFYSNEALENGLVDEIGDFSTAVKAIDELSNSPKFKSGTGSTLFANNNDMKIQLLATQVALASVLGAQFAENQESMEVDLTAENIEAINALIGMKSQEVSQLNATLSEKETALTAATDSLNEANTKFTELEEKYNLIKGETTNTITNGKNGGENKGIATYAEEGAEHIETARSMFNN